MKAQKQTLLAVATLIFLSSTGLAQDKAPKKDGPNPEALFKSLDKNEDGKLVPDEIGKEQGRFFDRLIRVADKNKDGELTKEEFLTGVNRQARDVNPQQGGQARGRGGNPGQFFQQLDKNKDGKITLEEVPEQMRPRLKPLFERLKKDAITQEEFSRSVRAAQDPAKMFARLDTNKDGKVSADEVPEQAKRMISGILRGSGKDPNETISQEEFVSAINKFRQQGAAANRRPDGNQPKRQGDRPRKDGDKRNAGQPNNRSEGDRRRPDGRDGRQPRLPLFFEILDANHDGQLSEQELNNAAKKLSELDQNKDGKLDPRELFGPPPEGRDGRRPPGEGRPPQRPDSDRPGRPNANNGRNNPGPEFAQRIFERFDTNKDGKLSKSEAPEKMQNRFPQLDKNNDGSVTLEELKAGLSQARGKRPDGNKPRQPNRKK